MKNKIEPDNISLEDDIESSGREDVLPFLENEKDIYQKADLSILCKVPFTYLREESDLGFGDKAMYWKVVDKVLDSYNAKIGVLNKHDAMVESLVEGYMFIEKYGRD